VHPGPDISLPAAASLAGITRKQARKALAALTRANLVNEHAPGRFAFHDLLRAYAIGHSDTLNDDPAECQADSDIGSGGKYFAISAQVGSVTVCQARRACEGDNEGVADPCRSRTDLGYLR
jgi:hypothetical protein